MEKTSGGIRSPLAPLGIDFHGRVEAALQQAALPCAPAAPQRVCSLHSLRSLCKSPRPCALESPPLHLVSCAPFALCTTSAPPLRHLCTTSAPPLQADCLERGDRPSNSFGWPSREMLLQGHLFDQGLINQALEIIEKRGGDFEITSFAAWCRTLAPTKAAARALIPAGCFHRARCRQNCCRCSVSLALLAPLVTR